MRTLLTAISNCFKAQAITPSGLRIGVALSGGADSVALLHALHALIAEREWQCELIAMHFNHGMTEFDDAAERFAVSCADALGLPCVFDRWDQADPNLDAIQHRARKARYAFFASAALFEKLDLILLAHHQDDQAETVLARAADGAWWDGLSGIPPRQHLRELVVADTPEDRAQLAALPTEILRPLLSISRDDLRATANQQGWSFLDDPENRDARFQRARLRETLLPLLTTELNPKAVPHLAGLAADLADVQDYLIHQVHARLPDREHDPAGAYCSFSLASLREMHAAIRKLLLREVLFSLGLSRRDARYERVEALLRMVSDGAPRVLMVTERVHARLDGSSLVLSASFADPRSPMLALRSVALDALPLQIDLRPRVNLCFSISQLESGELREQRVAEVNEGVAALSREALKGRLELRVRREGDRFQPVGAEREEEVRELMRRAGFRSELRTELPLICDAQGIVLIPGIGVARRACAREGELIQIAWKMPERES